MASTNRLDHPLEPFVRDQGVALIDGGLATQLEEDGYDLNHSLWSARLLIEHEDAIRQVHTRYLRAGADCIISSSYQATIRGFEKLGHSQAQAKSLLQRSVDIACEARNTFGQSLPPDRIRPIVAASVGPYGAYLADGSEYHGIYKVTATELRDFHKPRFEILGTSSADLLVSETIPSLCEAQVLMNLYHELEAKPGWLSFVCKDDKCLCDGTPIEEAIEHAIGVPNIIAVGVNCIRPSWVSSLLQRMRQGGWNRGFVVYPNSGETFDATHHHWEGPPNTFDYHQLTQEWLTLGAIAIGGCCRTTPDLIRLLRKTFKQNAAQDRLGTA